MRALIISCAICCFWACSSKTSQDQSKSDNNLDSLKHANNIVTGLTQYDTTGRSYSNLSFAQANESDLTNNNFISINKICYIDIIPDTMWINQQQKEMGDGWDEIVSDNEFYNSKMNDTLKKLAIANIAYERSEKRFIKFKKFNEQEFLLDTKKMIDGWGIILFNGKDNPVLWHSTEGDDAIKAIYAK